VAEQVAAAPGEEADASVWVESRALQARAGAREPFAWQECLVARPGVGLAWVEAAHDRTWSPLAERVRASFDPEGVLA
jgi:hypothetical protein